MLCHGQSVENQLITPSTKVETQQQIQVLANIVYDQSLNKCAKEAITVCDTSIASTANKKRLSHSLIAAQFRNPAHKAMYKKDYFALVSSTYYIQRKLYTLPYWFI